MCGWFVFCHCFSAGTFEKKSSSSLRPVFRSCKLASCRLFKLKVDSQNTFQGHRTDTSKPSGSGLLVPLPAFQIEICQGPHIRGLFLLHPALLPTLPIRIVDLCFWMFGKKKPGLSIRQTSNTRDLQGYAWTAASQIMNRAASHQGSSSSRWNTNCSRKAVNQIPCT